MTVDTSAPWDELLRGAGASGASVLFGAVFADACTRVLKRCWSEPNAFLACGRLACRLGSCGDCCCSQLWLLLLPAGLRETSKERFRPFQDGLKPLALLCNGSFASGFPSGTKRRIVTGNSCSCRRALCCGSGRRTPAVGWRPSHMQSLVIRLEVDHRGIVPTCQGRPQPCQTHRGASRAGSTATGHPLWSERRGRNT